MAGMIVWHELFTTDVDAATRFYAELLDAEIETQTVGDLEYPMLKKGDGNHCGFVHNPSDGQIPSLWYPYVHADDVDASTAKAQELGAQLIHGPQDVGDILRFAVLGDPQHATFGLLTGESEGPKGVFAWDELHATDVDAAATFYGDLAGWTTAEFMEGYRIFNAGETGVGGLMKERGGSPAAYWMTYLDVEEIDGMAARAMELGAGVILPTESMETIGRYAVLTDPTGAAFGLHEPPAETVG
jgi:predicted enzyme related to lactoylglutathione lyase